MAEKDKNKEGFINLKKIHEIQCGGFVQGLIRDLRSSRIQLDHILSEAFDIKKRNEIKNMPIVEEKIIESETVKEEKTEAKIEEQVKKSEEIKYETKQNFTPINKESNSRPFNNERDYRNNQGSYQGNRPFNQDTRPPYNQSGRPPYNQDGRPPFNQERRPYNQDGRPPFNQERPSYNQNGRPPYNQGGRPPYNQDGRPPYNQSGRPPYNQYNQNGQRSDFRKPSGTGFASSAENNFKSFVAEGVLPYEPARSFGNKNKSPNRDNSKDFEEKKSTIKQKNNKNVFVNNSDGFEEVRMGSRKLVKNKKEKEIFIAPQIEHAIITSDKITVKTLSEKTGKPVTEIIKKLVILGIMATINSTIDFETAELISNELGITLELKLEKTFEEKLKEKIKGVDNEKESIERPPVVTVMGHVDHGKTSLLDAIRKTDVATGEAGGITQKIGGYSIVAEGKKITFIDTPGHAAFTSMRIRGANVTDIAILVVAADDGVMPQTEEAIKHIKAAGVPMIVAVNKMDKPGANLEKTKQQLADKNVLSEEWGGDVIFVPISAKTGMGIDKLLETIHLIAEVQELRANPKSLATGVVIEAELDKNRGPVASVLVQNGTLHVGDNIVSGLTYGKVRAMYDDKGNVIKKAEPSVCVSVLGFYDVPNSGDLVSAIDEKLSKQVIQERKNIIKMEKAASTSGVSLEDFMSKVNEVKLKAINIIIKADVQGSVEALVQTLTEIKNDEAKVSCISSGVGFVTESDILLAKASSAIIIAFNVKTGPKAAQLAKAEKIQIKNYNIIYNVVDDLTESISAMRTIKYEQVVIGHGEVRAIFKLSSIGYVVGSYILDGKATKGSFVKIYRGDELICENQIESLRVVKDEKSEVSKGFECGIKIKDGNLAQVEDKLEFYENVPIKN
ncbi:MAG: translation initiation factor IF-2 [Clostridia bacterium]|nr:translation initiation factor IF-2 [Clostridia bacterium]